LCFKQLEIIEKYQNPLMDSRKRRNSFTLKKSSNPKRDSQKVRKKLETLDPDTIRPVPSQGKVILAKICGVYSGNTCTFIILIGGKIPVKFNAIIADIDIPEIRTVDSLEMDAAILVRNEVTRLIDGQVIPVRILKWNKYGGRLETQFYLGGEYNGLLSRYLIERGFAKPNSQHGREPWILEELLYIVDSLKK